MLEERSTLMSKQKELHWERDQDNKRLAREVQRLNEKAAQEKSHQAQHIEKLKEEIKERYSLELGQKAQDSLRSENLLNERISLLEKEVSKLEVQLL